MKNNRIFITGIMILAIVITSMFILLQLPQTEKLYEISVIVPASANDQWQRFEAGMRQASGDFGINVNFVNTTDTMDITEQSQLIEKEIQNGTDGLIIQFVSSKGCEDIIHTYADILPIELIETDVEMYDLDQSKVNKVVFDDEELSTSLTSQVFDAIGRDLRYRRVGIIAGNQDQESMQIRLENTKEILENAGASITWCIEGTLEEMSQQIETAEDVSVIVGLDSESLEAGIAYAQENEIPLYGIGCSNEIVSAMDRGIIGSMIVPEDFMMGYYSVRMIYEQLSDHKDMEDMVLGYNVVTKENMFSDTNENILFPISGE